MNIWQITNAGLSPTPGIPLTDRGFRYGQHFFETIAVRGGRPVFLDEHLALLRSSGAEAGFRCTDDIWQHLPGLSQIWQDSTADEGILRIYWTAGDGAPGTAPSGGRIFISWEPGPLPRTPQLLSLCLTPFPFSPLAGSSGAWKTGNYWQNLRAKEEALQSGQDEILLQTPAGRICGVAMGNIFYQLEDSWFTPPAADGARPGTTRQWLLASGFARERSLSTGEINEIGGWIVTNARVGPAPAAPPGFSFSPEDAILQRALWEKWLRC
jgi:branched-subunit amino acid aminotransferase/4-amino-4-deoxychorismate lyase